MVVRIAAALALAVLNAACASTSASTGRSLRAPYLHPTARLTLPDQIQGIRASDVHEFRPLDVAASYAGSGVLLTVYIYPANVIPDASLQAHFDAAMTAVGQKRGIRTANHLELPLKDDPRGPARAVFEATDRYPPVHGVLTVFQACSHIVKFRLSSDGTVSQARRFEMLDVALEAVLPRDFATKALESFGPGSCGVEVVEAKEGTRASADGCQVFWNPQSGPLGLQTALCAALDAKIAARGH